MPAPLGLPDGVTHWPQYLGESDQMAVLDAIRAGVAEAPLFVPTMPKTGKEMTVRMTNFGAFGWVTDKQNGYRYQDTHPVTGRPWPAIPDPLLAIWNAVSEFPAPPEACLVNFYGDHAKMGQHQDKDEEVFDAPVVSLSLGNDCLFRVGGTSRGGKTQSFRLTSGDVMMLSGPARLAFHGVDRIYPDTSNLLKAGGRINITMRRVTPVVS